MGTLSRLLGLKVPASTDRFSTQDIANNWNILDGSPGAYICTSTTRPGSPNGPAAWTSAQVGRKILEVNTGLEWVWTGSVFKRLSSGSGILTTTSGTPAIGERTSNFSTSSTDFVKVQGVTGVQVPDGHRPIMAVGIWYQADNNTGPFATAVLRSNVSNSGTVLTTQTVAGNPNGRGYGSQLIGFERGGLAPGTYDFSLQMRSLSGVGGTSFMYTTPPQPIQIVIIEL